MSTLSPKLLGAPIAPIKPFKPVSSLTPAGDDRDLNTMLDEDAKDATGDLVSRIDIPKPDAAPAAPVKAPEIPMMLSSTLATNAVADAMKSAGWDDPDEMKKRLTHMRVRRGEYDDVLASPQEREWAKAYKDREAARTPDEKWADEWGHPMPEAVAKAAAEGVDLDSLPWTSGGHELMHCIQCGTIQRCRCSQKHPHTKGVCFSCKREKSEKSASITLGPAAPSTLGTPPTDPIKPITPITPPQAYTGKDGYGQFASKAFGTPGLRQATGGLNADHFREAFYQANNKGLLKGLEPAQQFSAVNSLAGQNLKAWNQNTNQQPGTGVFDMLAQDKVDSDTAGKPSVFSQGVTDAAHNMAGEGVAGNLLGAYANSTLGGMTGAGDDMAQGRYLGAAGNVLGAANNILAPAMLGQGVARGLSNFKNLVTGAPSYGPLTASRGMGGALGIAPGAHVNGLNTFAVLGGAGGTAEGAQLTGDTYHDWRAGVNNPNDGLVHAGFGDVARAGGATALNAGVTALGASNLGFNGGLLPMVGRTGGEIGGQMLGDHMHDQVATADSARKEMNNVVEGVNNGRITGNDLLANRPQLDSMLDASKAPPEIRERYTKLADAAAAEQAKGVTNGPGMEGFMGFIMMLAQMMGGLFNGGGPSAPSPASPGRAQPINMYA
jgi:hypothetical protein